MYARTINRPNDRPTDTITDRPTDRSVVCACGACPTVPGGHLRLSFSSSSTEIVREWLMNGRLHNMILRFQIVFCSSVNCTKNSFTHSLLHLPSHCFYIHYEIMFTFTLQFTFRYLLPSPKFLCISLPILIFISHLSTHFSHYCTTIFVFLHFTFTLLSFSSHEKRHFWMFVCYNFIFFSHPTLIRTRQSMHTCLHLCMQSSNTVLLFNNTHMIKQ